MNNSFSFVHPEMVCEWSERNKPITPDMVTYGSNKEYWWKGKCGHEWKASVKSRSAGEKCPICSGARVVEGVNDLKTLFPELAKEWSDKNEIKPTQVSKGSHKKVLWKGKCGHEWKAVIKNRVSGSGCPYCSHNLLLEGYNDLKTIFPRIALEWSQRNLPLLPTQVTAFANKKVWWKCKTCGNEWNTLISTRSNGSNCPYCSGISLKEGYNDLATLYPMLVLDWDADNIIKPNEVNEKSQAMIKWKCHICGYKWKAKVKTVVSGSGCPVCSGKTVLKGYNDLETENKELMSEWDFLKNTILPSQVLSSSKISVWWKCSFGHSWKAKIYDRTVDRINCVYCESEFNSVLVRFLVSYYGFKKGIKVKVDCDDIIGLSLETYLPELKLSVITKSNYRNSDICEYLCNRKAIKIVELETEKEDKVKIADKVKGVFKDYNIYIDTNSENDIQYVRKRFFDIKRCK